MQKLSMRPAVSKAAVLIPLAAKLPQLYSARLTTISKMSGYPSAIHSIGRLQRQIRLDNMDSLLDSLFRVQNLAYTTAEVIDTMDGTKVDRHQLDRSQIVAYVTNIVGQLRNFQATAEEIEVIAHLITSFEANTSAWILQGGEANDDLHIKIKNLYKEVATSSSEDMTLPVFAPHSNSVIEFNKLPQVQELLKKNPRAKKGKAKDPASVGGIPVIERDDDAAATYTMYQYACMRIIDHVYQLLLDKDTWYAFVAPRTKADVQTNLERSKTLRSLALYCQSLLTYYQFFSLEMFMKSYELVQEWILHFPPLDVNTVRDLEGIVRKYDLLGAKDDVHQLVMSFADSGRTDLGALIFPSEFVGRFGLAESVDKISADASQFTLSGDLTNLSELDTPQYLPLISGVAASTLDVSYRLSNILLLGKVVSNEVSAAIAGLLPSMTGGASELTISRFKALSIKASLPFIVPHAAAWHVEKGTEKGVEGGTLHLDSASPTFSQAYHEFVRNELRFKFTTDRQIASSYSGFNDRQVYDWDRARALREVMEYNWKTLIPAQYGAGDEYFDYAILSASPEAVRQMIERLSGINYEIAIRELALPHLRKLWATFVSSFALLYVDKDAESAGPLKDAKTWGGDPGKVDLVEGHGSPYGTTYASLEAAQGTLTPKTEILNLGYGLYLRLLSVIPVVTDELRLDELFFDRKPVMYFSSNSAKEPVKKWVIADGLANFALLPLFGTSSVPAVKFTPKYAYLTQNLYINTDLYFRPHVAAPSRENYNVGVTTSDWKDDRRYYFLTYTHLGKYSSEGVPAGAIEDETLVVDAVKKVEDLITQDQKQQATDVKDAGKASDESANAAKTEVSKGLNTHTGSGKDAGADTVKENL